MITDRLKFLWERKGQRQIEGPVQSEFLSSYIVDLPNPELIRTIDIDALSVPQKENLYHVRHLISSCDRIIVVNSDSGMGDDVMSLRARRCIQEAFPGKVLSILHPSLRGLPHFLETQDSNEINSFTNYFVIDVSTATGNTELAEHKIQDAAPLLASKERVGLFSYHEEPLRSLHNSFSRFLQSRPETECQADLLFYFFLAVLGIDGCEDFYSAPVFAVNQDSNDLKDQILIVPDAAGLDHKTNKYRSIKSPTIHFWRSIIFDSLREKEQEVIISKGISHPQYCDDLIDAARKSGLRVRVMEGPLGLLISAAISSKMIITGDNGPSHLINEVLLAGNRGMPRQRMLQLFNADSKVAPNRFCIRGLGENGLISAYDNF